MTIAQTANSMTAVPYRSCLLEAIEKLTRRDNFDVIVTLKRKKIAAEAAKFLDVDFRTVSNREKGRVKPTAEHTAIIVRFLGYDPFASNA